MLKNKIKCSSSILSLVIGIFCMTLSCFNANATEKTGPRETISLAGNWKFQADPENLGEKEKWYEKTLGDSIKLPGSTDEKGVGGPEKYRDPYNALIRKSFYVGKAWYQKEVEIPKSWGGRRINLFLERCHWVTQVWVDDQYVGTEDSLCVAHEYELSKFLTAGKHKITICVDNSLKYFLGQFASSYSQHTQTNWNGIIGRIELNATDKIWIKEIQAFPLIAKKQVKVKVTVGNQAGKPVNGNLALQVLSKDGNNLGTLKDGLIVEGSESVYEEIIQLGDDVQLWDEFNPVLYQLKANIDIGNFSDSAGIKFGMREVSVKDKQICLNGKKVYLRGTLECCVFPLTGYPPMTVEEWSRIMKICKSYGLNHVRFHSWCPPEAAFIAADMEGVYLQPEAPRANVGVEKARDEFIEREMYKINQYYGNSPSFLLMTGGNELHSATSGKTRAIMEKIKKSDPRHLLSTSSGGHGMSHKETKSRLDDYRVYGVRGIFGESTDKDHSERIANYAKPIITHEVGQWQIYPAPDEIKKYTGVLRPVNIEYIRDDLKKKGLLHLAPEFREVTGKQAALLYKEEIEVLLRTHQHAGFQLLDLHDYPGQGTAQVGLLDAFWDTKNAISPEMFRRFCSETVPLLRMPKRTYTNAEKFEASAEIIHYGNRALKNVSPLWTMTDDAGEIMASGKLEKVDLVQGERTQIGKIVTDLSVITEPKRLKVTISIPGTDVSNDWNIWVYPAKVEMEAPENIVVSKTIDAKVEQALEEGKNVLLLPTARMLKNILPGRFKPSFWSPTWWWTRPRGGNVTMSILCDPKHPALKYFPTSKYSDWQWLDLQEKSSSFMLQKLPVKIDPIVRVVDNFSRNNNLGSIFEAQVGNGKILVCGIDIDNNLTKRPVARQLRYSLLKYMQSDEFEPKQTIALNALENIYRTKPILSEIGAKVIATDSEQASYEAAKAIDGNAKTMWHTQWKPETVSYPHEFTIELPKKIGIEGFVYLPRQDQNSGWIKDYEIYLSNDGKKWGGPVLKGTLSKSKDEQKLMFPRLKHKCRYIRFVAKTGHTNACAAIAEFDIIPEK